ncbi:MAG: Endoribonuclease ToxN [Firmicutes bacterium]|nr:Endoribonuclease ToxN [Bacillota bacterium]
METLKFYEVDHDYLRFLQRWDAKVPNVSATSHEKFTCGVVLGIGPHKYFAPISSFSKKQQSNILILNSVGRAVASIRFSFMFPIPEGLAKVKDFSKEEIKYRELLREELSYCNGIREQIRAKAQWVYASVVSRKDPFMISNCCSFTLLEEKAREYAIVLEQAKLASQEVSTTTQEPRKKRQRREDDR